MAGLELSLKNNVVLWYTVKSRRKGVIMTSTPELQKLWLYLDIPSGECWYIWRGCLALSVVWYRPWDHACLIPRIFICRNVMSKGNVKCFFALDFFFFFSFPGAEESSTNFLERKLTKSGPMFTRFSRTRSHLFNPKKHTEPAQWKN